MTCGAFMDETNHCEHRIPDTAHTVPSALARTVPENAARGTFQYAQ